jgi:hypothetical protein
MRDSAPFWYVDQPLALLGVFPIFLILRCNTELNINNRWFLRHDSCVIEGCENSAQTCATLATVYRFPFWATVSLVAFLFPHISIGDNPPKGFRWKATRIVEGSIISHDTQSLGIQINQW